MSTLAEIAAAADKMTPREEQELILFAARLRASGGDLPPPRVISKEQIKRWILEDEEGYRRFVAAT